MVVLCSSNYGFGQNDQNDESDSDILETFFSENPGLRILYIIGLFGLLILVGWSDVFLIRMIKKIRHRKRPDKHSTGDIYKADGKKIIGSLPKGYSGEEKRDLNDGARTFRILQGSLVFLCANLAFTGLFIGLFLAGQEPSEEHDETWISLVVYSFASWIVGLPLLIGIIRKYRRSQLTSPTEFTKMYFRCREPHQCTICKKHPVSKKYHLKNEHKLKDFRVDDYFQDCGCDKCARYDKSSLED